MSGLGKLQAELTAFVEEIDKRASELDAAIDETSSTGNASAVMVSGLIGRRDAYAEALRIFTAAMKGELTSTEKGV